MWLTSPTAHVVVGEGTVDDRGLFGENNNGAKKRFNDF